MESERVFFVAQLEMTGPPHIQEEEVQPATGFGDDKRCVWIEIELGKLTGWQGERSC